MTKTTSPSLAKVFATYVSYNIIGMVGISVYILADTYFVANGIGPTALGALNIAIPVFSLANGTGLLIGVGAATLVAYHLGANEKSKAENVFGVALLMGAVAGLAYFLLGAFGAYEFAELLGAKEPELRELAGTYAKIILLGTPLFIINDIILSVARSDGSPGLAMGGMVAGSMANIFLDWLFIYEFKWGMTGAAGATILAPVISMAILAFHWKGKKAKASTSEISSNDKLNTASHESPQEAAAKTANEETKQSATTDSQDGSQAIAAGMTNAGTSSPFNESQLAGTGTNATDAALTTHRKPLIPSLPKDGNYRLREIFSQGLPPFITELASGIVIVVFNYLFLELAGVKGVAAYGVVANISLVLVAIFAGLAQGAQPLVGEAKGAGRMADEKWILKASLGLCAALAVVTYIYIFVDAERIASFFNKNNDPELASLAVNGLRIYFLGAIFEGLNIVAIMHLTAILKPKAAQLITILRGAVLIIPMALVMSLLGVNGVWMSFPVTEITVMLLSVYFLIRRHA